MRRNHRLLSAHRSAWQRDLAANSGILHRTKRVSKVMKSAQPSNLPPEDAGGLEVGEFDGKCEGMKNPGKRSTDQSIK